MATATKAELEETLNNVENLVGEALDPELTREELVAKVKEIADLVITDDDSDDDTEDDDTGDDDQDDDR